MITLKQIRSKLIMLPQLSENAADSVYWLGWIFVLISAVSGLTGTILGLWGDRERERYSDLRISDNEKETAKANERAVLLQRDAAADRLELAKMKGAHSARGMSMEPQTAIMNALSDAKGKKVSVVRSSDTREAVQYCNLIEQLMTHAGLVLTHQNEVFSYRDQSKSGIRIFMPDPVPPTPPQGQPAIPPACELADLILTLRNAFKAAGVEADTEKVKLGILFHYEPFVVIEEKPLVTNE